MTCGWPSSQLMAASPPASMRRSSGPSAASAVKIKFRLNASSSSSSSNNAPKAPTQTGRQPRAAAQKSKGRTKQVALEQDMPSDEDELILGDGDDENGTEEVIDVEPDVIAEGEDDDDDDELGSIAGSSRRSASPSKMTARQRAKGNRDLQDTLLALPLGELVGIMKGSEAHARPGEQETSVDRGGEGAEEGGDGPEAETTERAEAAGRTGACRSPDSLLRRGMSGPR